MRLGRGKTILFIIVVAGALPLLTADLAWSQTPPCDFVTGGGFILRDSGAHGNFGVAGGCKNGSPTWGHLEYLDHGSYPLGSTATVPPPFQVHGTGVTGYFFIDTMTRDITGTARTNDQSHPNVNYCVEVSDNDAPGGNDTFVIQLKDQFGVVFYTTQLDTDHTVHGGNIELHKHNPSTTGSFSNGSCLVGQQCAGTDASCGNNGVCVACDTANGFHCFVLAGDVQACGNPH